MHNQRKIRSAGYLFVACVGLLTLLGGCDETASQNYDKTASQDSVLLPQPGGIANVGLTCYVNATMQMMAAFYPNMFDPKRVSDRKSKKLAEEGSKVIQIINEGKTVDSTQAKAFFAALKDVHNTPSRKQKANQDPSKENDLIKLGKQGDAQEMLTTIFDALAFPQAKKTIVTTNPTTKEDNTSDTKDPWNLLRVDVRAKDEHAQTPEYPSEIDMQFLEEFFRATKVENRDWVTNGKTEKITAYQTPKLGCLSNLANGILPLYIRRYAQNSRLSTKAKNVLSLTIKKKHVYDNQAADISYNLRGFILQDGSLYAGHYVTWLYREDRNQWYYISDSSVEQKTAAEAKSASEDAYVFFYQAK